MKSNPNKKIQGVTQKKKIMIHKIFYIEEVGI